MRPVTFALRKEMSVTHVIPYIEPHSFTLRKDRPCVWLQRICLFVLSCLGAYNRGQRYHEQEWIHTKQITINPDDFMKSLFEMKRELYEHFGKRPGRCYLGPNEFYAITGQRVYQELQFSGRYFTSNGPHHQANIHGIEIHVIPWMEGMLIL